MAYSSLVDTQATKSSLALRPRHVHVLLFGLIFPGEETLHHLLPSFPLRVIFHLLQVGDNGILLEINRRSRSYLWANLVFHFDRYLAKFIYLSVVSETAYFGHVVERTR